MSEEQPITEVVEEEQEPVATEPDAGLGGQSPESDEAPGLGGQSPESDEAEEEEAVDYLAMAQRVQADFDNYRKRMAREQSAAVDRGIRKLAEQLLPALDHLDVALGAIEDPEVVNGVRLVQGEFLAALKRVGVEPFSPDGDPFDPNEHEAMAQQPVEGVEPGTVVQVYQQGYRLGGQLLRPARVVVAA
jgi:molecular chaperone GrpE